MSIRCGNAITWCWLALILSASAVTVSAEDRRDPTVPSQQISELLGAFAQGPVAAAPEEHPQPVEPVPLRLRLKGLVLRDDDRGVALISVNDKETYRLRLRRPQGDSKTAPLMIGGKRFVVEDFTPSAIILRCTDDGELWIVR